MFSGKVLRLNEIDFKAFQGMHGGGNAAFMAYLQARDQWYDSQAPAKQKSWFIATKNNLANRIKQEETA